MINAAYLVGIGGAIGALLRYFVEESVDDSRWPRSTLTVNVVGSFVLGLVTFLSLDDRLLLLVGTGVCGSFTTFSTFSVDVVQLWEGDRWRAAVGYATVNLAGALLAIGLAWLVTSTL